MREAASPAARMPTSIGAAFPHGIPMPMIIDGRRSALEARVKASRRRKLSRHAYQASTNTGASARHGRRRQGRHHCGEEEIGAHTVRNEWRLTRSYITDFDSLRPRKQSRCCPAMHTRFSARSSTAPSPSRRTPSPIT